MIQLPFSDARWDNLNRYGVGGERNGRQFEACILCCKPVYLDKPHKLLRMDVDGNAITNEEAEDETNPNRAQDQGAFAIGPECLRNHPELKPYVQEGDIR